MIHDNYLKQPLRLGVSACLIGKKVRYNGEHRQVYFITDVLGEHAKLVPVCPEVEIGMGVPREKVQLERSEKRPRLIGLTSRTDWTKKMYDFAERRPVELGKNGLDGYIFKSGSPSCGTKKVLIYRGEKTISRKGVGIFATAIIKKFPLMPVEDESALESGAARDNFIVRLFAYRRLKNLLNERFNREKLTRFHNRHRLLLMAHSPQNFKLLEKLVANIRRSISPKFIENYGTLFTKALSCKAPIRQNVKVLNEIAAHLKKQLTQPEKDELSEAIFGYEKGLLPLIVPLTLLRHHVTRYEIEELADQYYLNPHPLEIKLRFHA